MTGHQLNESNKEPFKDYLLKNVEPNSDFGLRSKNVFDAISSLEENHEKWQLQNRRENQKYVKQDPVIEGDSKPTFKMPAIQPGSLKRPHPSSGLTRFHPRDRYDRDPKKWKKYTLADVSDQDMSEKSNTGAAMSFLAQRKRQKLETATEEQTSLKPVFSKPINSKKDDACASETSVNVASSSGRIVMPEYVVGLKKSNKDVLKKGHSTFKSTATSKNLITLNHLDEDNEELSEMDT